MYPDRDTVNAIRDSLDYYKRCDPIHIRFAFSGVHSMFGLDEDAVEAVREAFVKLGFDPQPADTLDVDFNLDRDWYFVDCPKCIRDYRYALPITDDVDTLAQIVMREQQGSVRILVFEQDD